MLEPLGLYDIILPGPMAMMLIVLARGFSTISKELRHGSGPGNRRTISRKEKKTQILFVLFPKFGDYALRYVGHMR